MINQPMLKEVIAKAISDYTGLARRTDKAKSNVADLAIANGFLWTDFISDKKSDSTASPETYAFLKAAVVAGFTADVRALLDKPSTSGLSEKQKSDRRYWQQQIGARMNDLKNAVKARQQAKANGANATTRTAYQIVDETLSKWAKRADMFEGVSEADAKALRKAITDMQTIIRKVAKAKATG